MQFTTILDDCQNDGQTVLVRMETLHPIHSPWPFGQFAVKLYYQYLLIAILLIPLVPIPITLIPIPILPIPMLPTPIAISIAIATPIAMHPKI